MTVEPYGPQPITTDLAVPGNNVERLGAMLKLAAEIAHTVADTDFVPDSIRGNTPAVTAVILYGDELGIGAMQALASIDFIKGKPSPSAHLLRAMIYRAGHSFLIHEATGVRCKVSGLRRGRPELERVHVTWDLDMARAAGLMGAGGNWQRYPRSMLLARATTELARQVFPDVTRGLGGIGEDLATVEETATWTQDSEAPAAAATTVQRRPRKRSGTKAVAQDTEPGPQPAAPAEPPTAPEADLPAPVAPEQPSGDGEPPPPTKMASAPLLRGYHAAFREAGIPEQDRAFRLAVTSYVVGRNVDSSTELTRAEALRVTGALAEVATGASEIVWDERGEIVIQSTRKEPPPAEGGPDA